MPVKNEAAVRPGYDAPESMSTQLCFDPPNGPFDEDNVVTGQITDGDKDWIVIELSEGKEYTITVSGKALTVLGRPVTALNDTVLRLLDGKGGEIMMNDDIVPAGTAARATNLGSRIKFTPEAGSGTQKYFLEVSAYTGNPFADNAGGYQVSVAEEAVLPVGDGPDIKGTDAADKLTGTAASESIMGLEDNDTLVGAGGDDKLHGGVGNDLLIGGKGADELRGGKHDAYVDGVGGDTISYQGSAMGVTINLRDGSAMGGDAEGDTLPGGDIENVIGSAYDDMITGTDSVTVGNSLWGLAGMDRLYGGEGNDELYGGPGDDMLEGGDEDDTLEGGPGADTLTGGLGADTASYKNSTAGVIVRLHSGQAMGGDAEGDIWGNLMPNPYTLRGVEMTEMVPDIENLTGSGMADVLAGDGRANTIMGGGGDDRIFGGPAGGDDTLHGDGGNDHLFGGRGNDILRGGRGNDHLWGNGGADTYHGGPGSDTIHANRADIAPGRPARSVDGHGSIAGETTGTPPKRRADMDTLSFANFTDSMLEDGTGITLSLEGNTVVVNIDSLIGTEESDTLTGSDGAAETIEGADGGDRLVGGDNVRQPDGTGGDTVSYRSSDRGVRIALRDGTDSTASGSTASGGHASGDTISGFENAIGSAFDDELTAHSGGSTLRGLAGDDELTGGVGRDTIIGGPGADEVDGGTSAASAAATDDDGADTSPDTLSYEGSDAAVTVNLATLSASGGHAEGDEIEAQKDAYDPDGPNGPRDPVDVATFEYLTGSDYNDHLTGDHRMNWLTGGKGNDTLRGLEGADTLNGGPGADMLDGGSSTWNHDSDTDTDGTATANVQHEDWAVYRNALLMGVEVDLNTNRGTGGEAMGDTLKNIELVWGSRQDDTFIASEDADIIHGDGGSDTVSYEASKQGVTVVLTGNGSTTFDADGPDDTAGNDDDNVFLPATDTIVGYWRAGGSDDGANSDRPTPVQADSATVRSFAEGDILASIENVTGSSLDDTITGDAVPNVIRGGAGNDRISGGAQDDKLYGGAGNDVLGARPAEDLNDDGDMTDPGEPAAQDAGDDMMYGGDGRDEIYGGTGNDTINGGTGDDTLTGGTGNDTFVFEKGHGSDVITDFNAGNNGVGGDRIDLSAFNLTAADLKAPGVIRVFADNIVINLANHGGGTITLQGRNDLDLLDTEANDDGNDIGTLSVSKDADGDNDFTGTGDVDGIFIL